MLYEGCRRQHTLKWGEYRDIKLYGMVREDWEGNLIYPANILIRQHSPGLGRRLRMSRLILLIPFGGGHLQRPTGDNIPTVVAHRLSGRHGRLGIGLRQFQDGLLASCSSSLTLLSS